jgi:DNA-binding IclR family transcriptional regulator
MGAMQEIREFVPLDDPLLTVGEGATDRQFATTLARGLEVLRCFTAEEPILGNKEISERAMLPKATVSRLTYTLTLLGYLRFLAWAGKYGKYELGPAVLSIGYPLLANLSLRQLAKQPMKELAEYARGWVTLGMRDRLNMVYVEAARSSGAPKSLADIGQTFPILMSAMGRAYLAALPEMEREAVVNQIKVKTPEIWKQHAPRLFEALADFRHRGFCLHRGAINPHVHTVAVPLRQAHRDVVVFNCVVPRQLVRPGALEQELGPRLKEMVSGIASCLEGGARAN